MRELTLGLEKMPLYEQVAQYIHGLVNIGTLEPGDKAPSLRGISKQRGISISTALQAYRLLEDRGVLEARPKSGYFVSKTHLIELAEPAASTPQIRAESVTISDTLLELMDHASNPDMAPLGCAIPSAELLAANRLDRFLSRAARHYGQQHNVYSTPQGESQLRQAIAKRGMGQGLSVSADEIVVTSGCTEALGLALKALTKPGDTVIVESPTYFGILHLLESLRLKVLELPTSPATGIDIAALASALSGHGVAACLLSSCFNNPMGFSITDDAKRDILELLWQHQVPLIEDDIYGELFFSAKRPHPFSAFDTKGNVIYCSSFSKTVAPGYRVGWIIPGSHMRSVLKNKMAQSLCCPILPQIAIAEYLKEGGYDHHLRRIRRTFQLNINKMRRAIGQNFPNSTKVTNPEGGFVLWLELDKKMDTRHLLEQALQMGICFAPGDVFSPSAQFSNCLRLSCGHEWNKRIDNAVDSLAELLKPQGV